MINRRTITYLLLCTSLMVLVVAQWSFRKPNLWRWAQVEPLRLPISTAATPVEREITSASPSRRAPYPIMKVLDGAQDMEPFLSPNPVAIPEMQLSAKAEKDAEARYHLLQLSRDANPGALEADARTDFRYRALAQKPHEYRGELIKIRGDLISLGEPMELQRKVPGMDICYVGLIASEQADHQYLILFTDLPEGLPPMKEWSKLYIRNIEFSGYYYKVAKFTRAEGKIRTWMLPVLVGKTVQLPAQTNEGMEWFNLITVYLAMAIPVIFTALILPRYFRSSDKAHECLMQEYRQRRERRIQESLDEFNHH